MSLTRPVARRRALPRLHLGRWGRRPLLYWSAAAALAGVAALTVGGMVGAADAARTRFGEVRSVAVVVRDLPAGHVLATGDVELHDLPAAVVPAGALADPSTGGVLNAAVFAGEALLGGRLAPEGRGPLAALLPQGMRGVAVPTGPGSLRLTRGDLVDVIATFEPSLAGDDPGPPTFPVARAALVVDVDDEAVTIAVAEREAARVAFALSQGVVTLALAG